MKHPRSILIYLLLGPFLPSSFLCAQEKGKAEQERDALTTYMKDQYGFDQELHRGYLYYNAYFQCMGNPYFPSEAFQRGSLRRSGIVHDGLSLRYDCHAQQVTMAYTGSGGGYMQLILEGSRVDSFSLGALQFQKMAPDGLDTAFYQVIRRDSLACFVHWSCSKLPLNDYSKRYLYRFSTPSASCFIRYREELFPVSGKKDFLSLFPSGMHARIRQYLREQRFSFKKPGHEEIESLIAHMDSQLKNLNTE
jgi:hypothetical protein